MKKIFLLIFLSSTAIATTKIKIETTPVRANISCDGKVIGVVPIQFTLEDGKHNCVLTHKLMDEPISFALDVNNEESVLVSMILIPGRMTEEQKTPSIHRVVKPKGTASKSPEDHSSEAEALIMSKKGPAAQRLIDKLAELKQPSSDGGAALTASELNDLRRAANTH